MTYCSYLNSLIVNKYEKEKVTGNENMTKYYTKSYIEDIKSHHKFITSTYSQDSAVEENLKEEKQEEEIKILIIYGRFRFSSVRFRRFQKKCRKYNGYKLYRIDIYDKIRMK
jgi:hypothetical protein